MRPSVNIVQNQEEIASREITGSEADAIMARYGYGNSQFSTRQEEKEVDPTANLSFEDMMRLQDEKENSERMAKAARQNGPKPITFNGNGGYDTEVKHTASGGYGFKIEISTDMKLPKY